MPAVCGGSCERSRCLRFLRLGFLWDDPVVRREPYRGLSRATRLAYGRTAGNTPMLPCGHVVGDGIRRARVRRQGGGALSRSSTPSTARARARASTGTRSRAASGLGEELDRREGRNRGKEGEVV